MNLKIKKIKLGRNLEYKLLTENMLQSKLLSTYENVIYKSFFYENISAIFSKIWDWEFEVLLNVNSNKFLIHLKVAMNKIEQFEILAVKWFVDLSVNLLKVLKRIVYSLYFEV